MFLNGGSCKIGATLEREAEQLRLTELRRLTASVASPFKHRSWAQLRGFKVPGPSPFKQLIASSDSGSIVLVASRIEDTRELDFSDLKYHFAVKGDRD